MYLRKSEDGFTIIELYFIIAIIVAITLTSFVVYNNKNSHPNFSLLPTKIGKEQCPNGNLDVNFAYAQIALRKH